MSTNDPAGSNPYEPIDQSGGQASPYGAPPAASPYGTPAGTPYGTPPPGPYGAAPVPYAHWLQRVGATLLDSVFVAIAEIPLFIGAIVAGATTTTHTDPMTGQVVTDSGPNPIAWVLIVLGAVIAIAFAIWNFFIRQGRTGYTLGKSVLGIKLVRESTGQPVGAGIAFVRQILHVVDSIACYLGWLWPLWDAKRQTFSDKIIGTVVLQQPKG